MAGISTPTANHDYKPNAHFAVDEQKTYKIEFESVIEGWTSPENEDCIILRARDKEDGYPKIYGAVVHKDCASDKKTLRCFNYVFKKLWKDGGTSGISTPTPKAQFAVDQQNKYNIAFESVVEGWTSPGNDYCIILQARDKDDGCSKIYGAVVHEDPRSNKKNLVDFNYVFTKLWEDDASGAA